MSISPAPSAEATSAWTPTDVLLERLHLVPDELCTLPQWLVWRCEGGSKIPYESRHPHRRAKVNDPATWSDFQSAIDTFADRLGRADQFTGIGVVFSGEDGFVGVDLDDCVEDDAIHPAARKIIDALGGYSEISPSGTGVKVWTRGRLNIQNTGTSWPAPWGGKVEVYHRARWFAVTGWRIEK